MKVEVKVSRLVR